MNDNQEHRLPMQLTPVGEVRSEIKTPMLIAGESDIELQERLEKIREYHQKVENNICELLIFPQWAELLDGIDLETLVDRYGPVAPERAVHLLRQICHSLSDAHERGFIHRDVKPSNVLIRRDGTARQRAAQQEGDHGQRDRRQNVEPGVDPRRDQPGASENRGRSSGMSHQSAFEPVKM